MKTTGGELLNVKLNTDGGHRGEINGQGSMAFGGLIRDLLGDWKVGLIGKLKAPGTQNWKCFLSYTIVSIWQNNMG